MTDKKEPFNPFAPNAAADAKRRREQKVKDIKDHIDRFKNEEPEISDKLKEYKNKLIRLMNAFRDEMMKSWKNIIKFDSIKEEIISDFTDLLAKITKAEQIVRNIVKSLWKDESELEYQEKNNIVRHIKGLFKVMEILDKEMNEVMDKARKFMGGGDFADLPEYGMAFIDENI